MQMTAKSYASVAGMLQSSRPTAPVYCIYPDVYRETARAFVDGFPGRVLYAVKANDHPAVIRLINEAGVTHFDCASVPEIERVRSVCPDAIACFMVPVRLRGAAREAQDKYAVRHFMVDHPSGLALLAGEIDMQRAVVFARMAAHHHSAMQDLSTKFGAAPGDVPALLQRIAAGGAEPALAFNVGSAVTDPEAYSQAMELAAGALRKLPFRVRLLDIGGGFPKSYPGFDVLPLADYFARIRTAASMLPLADNGEIMGEPGRALAAPGLSAVVEVLLRKNDRLYINDGMYGIFWELRFRGHDRYPVRAFRDGEELRGGPRPFKLFGPTCDGTDVLPGQVELPDDMRPGDYLEFGNIGAYSLSGRTRFNGHFSDHIVTIADGQMWHESNVWQPVGLRRA
jgi:ornithine decarboxylase